MGGEAMTAVIALSHPDACHDCFRPPNAGGVHNAGCRVAMRRFCEVCWAQHDCGDDCHRINNGVYCSEDTVRAMLEAAWPGRSADYCAETVRKRVGEAKRDREVVEWVRESALHREVLRAALRGARVVS